MIFLVEYKRQTGTLVSLKSFDERDRAMAEDARLQLELNLHATGESREVVLLEAADEVSLRRTHQRYFDTLAGILASSDLVDSMGTAH